MLETHTLLVVTSPLPEYYFRIPPSNEASRNDSSHLFHDSRHGLMLSPIGTVGVGLVQPTDVFVNSNQSPVVVSNQSRTIGRQADSQQRRGNGRKTTLALSDLPTGLPIRLGLKWKQSNPRVPCGTGMAFSSGGIRARFANKTNDRHARGRKDDRDLQQTIRRR